MLAAASTKPSQAAPENHSSILSATSRPSPTKGLRGRARLECLMKSRTVGLRRPLDASTPSRIDCMPEMFCSSASVRVAATMV